MPNGKPDEKVLLNNLGKIAYTLDKAYLSRLTADYAPVLFDGVYNKNDDKTTQVDYASNIRALRVKQWIFDEKEKSGECFKNVLSLFADGDHTVALVVVRRPTASEMYFVIKNDGAGRNEVSKNNIELLDDSIRGNFPGTHTEVIGAPNSKQTVKDLFSFPDAGAIAVLSNMPSEYSEDYITQGLDKLLNGIVPKTEEESYAVVFLAESLTPENIREILSGFEEMATAIHPFLEYQFQIGSNKTDTQGEMKSIADTESVSDSTSKTHSVNIGLNAALNIGRALGVAHMIGKAVTNAIAAGVGVGGRHVNAHVDVSHAVATSDSDTTSATHNRGLSVGVSAGYGYSWGKTKTVANGKVDTKGTSSSVSLGESENTSYTYHSYTIANLMAKLEKTMERISQSQATGLWRFATYVLAQDAMAATNIANYLRAVTQGSDSFIEPSAIQVWAKETKAPSPFGEIKKYVTHFTHPLFATLKEEEDGMLVTPTAYVETDKLSHVMVFPRKSVQGLPVLQCVQFGREPNSLGEMNPDMEIGCAYHMHEKIDNQRIRLSKEELTKHTFITGSTGSGKSNTIYKLLENLTEQDVNFLVVEPAKGEYKAVFGSCPDVTVYGTNPNLTDTQLLRVNPFRFPKSVHVLEHLDRLVEIFNVCWPMYAAMPAILKDSLERAYRAAGWDLMKSKNKYDDRLFPTFADVVTQIRQVLDESDYSADNKGDYTGSLVTRLRSLTNGINGLIFTADDIADEQLFDGNVIVDLSRVGSMETKALIMGLLVLKLQEHRMDQRSETEEINSGLRHITVLEEAHNLLKRTSTEQTTEGANLLGKSVEMLANSIAEMRTYGEGFIIADQSPGLLDLSVIRNTNTKIILRLPDFSDRELVGRAAGLDDKQIVELGRLEKGVAAITQSDWLEPVLCKVDKYEATSRRAARPARKGPPSMDVSQEEPVEETLLDLIMNRKLDRQGDRVDIQRLWEKIVRSRLDVAVKCSFMEYISSEGEKAVEPLRSLAYEFLHADQAIEALKEFADIRDWSAHVLELLNPSVKGYTQQQINLVLALIVYEQAVRDISYRQLFIRFTEVFRAKGGVL